MDKYQLKRDKILSLQRRIVQMQLLLKLVEPDEMPRTMLSDMIWLADDAMRHLNQLERMIDAQ